MKVEDISRLIQKTNETNSWISKKIFLQFNEAQYNALLKGYKVHWDMRYGLHFIDDYYYIHRSGHVVGKFKIEKIEDDLYQIKEMYDNPEMSLWYYVFDILGEACRQNFVRLDLDSFQMMQKKTYEMQEENQ